MKRREVGFLGAGNMASAMIKGLVEARLFRPAALWATDVVSSKRRQLVRRYGIGWARDNRELVEGSEIVVLAVKPQTLPEVLGVFFVSVSPRN
ncbi:MAG: pyrroline-5-carboxylate reductase family protein, partial [Candidatus Binatia bacterium]